MDHGAEIRRLRAEGLGLGDIARSLQLRGVPTPSGTGVWWRSTVRAQLDPARHAAYQREYRRRKRRDARGG